MRKAQRAYFALRHRGDQDKTRVNAALFNAKELERAVDVEVGIDGPTLFEEDRAAHK
jgi:glucose/arabinose dehydrogenase